MQCPYCKGDIPDDAVKCMHCGEWVKQRPAAAEPEPAGPFRARTPGDMFGRVWRGGLTSDDVVEGVRWYVKYRIVMAVVGAIVFLIFLFAVFLPNWNQVNGGPLVPRDPYPCRDATSPPDGFPVCP